MTEEKVKLVVGGLLHDIGKVLYRQGDGRKHSISGYDFLKDEAGIESKEILECVKYHHGSALRNANIDKKSFAYITYIADNIAAATDRRTNDSEDKGFEMTAPLEPVFNILNENNQKKYYHMGTLDEKEEINFPTDKVEKFDEHFYYTVKTNVLKNLRGININQEEYINSLLEVMEGNLSYVPSSTAKGEVADISLYDHVKLTAALNGCIYDYLEYHNINDYNQVLLKDAVDFYQQQVFCLLSMDISGIQEFIYTVDSEGALKNLRARSFYLEIFMEHLIDTLLQRLELSRANLLYCGGGHCYMLLPNTENTKTIVETFEKELNNWLLEQFDISLYVAVGMAPCSAQQLKNCPQGSYKEIFRTVSSIISDKKAARYTANEIRWLNSRKAQDYTRECRVCKRIAVLDKEKRCPMCAKIMNLSKDVLKADFFMILEEGKAEGLPLPFHKVMKAESKQNIKASMQTEGFVRAYGKNQMFTGKSIATKLWVGDYTTGESFKELAKKAEGIERIGILRADVDNLGKTFVSGFENKSNQDKYVTLSRTATLSRQLSLFFKHHINYILSHPQYTLSGEPKEKRNITIVYSGGDDLFLVGAWDDVLEASIDIKEAFRKYTENTLSISAGIGLYQSNYPIHVSAKEVAGLEEDSKRLPEKSAVTFLPDGEVHEEYDALKKMRHISDGTYKWNVFVDEVIGEKYCLLKKFFSNSEDRGNSFLYHLLELVRRKEDKINLARYAYLLARMEPDRKASEEQRQNYKEFSRKMYQWREQEKDCRQLKTAITLYAYIIRKKGEEQ